MMHSTSLPPRLPPGQQLVAAGKWPLVGERVPSNWSHPWRLEIAGAVLAPASWTLDELRRLPATTQEVDIHCVTRWSKLGVVFTGTLLATLLEACQPAQEARFVSFVAHSPRHHSSSLPLDEALAAGTLLAWECEGSLLPEVHGGPLRGVVPGRYFYKSVKWLARIELLASDRLGFWETTAGYHNQADPWRELRYMAPALDRRTLAPLLASRNFSGHDLRSLDARGCDLCGLRAAEALLRDADFRGARLAGAVFARANLSNAHFEGADLRHASLTGADAEGANFTGADLRDADFTATLLTAATFVAEDSSGRGALINPQTRFDPSALDALTPLQQAYVRQAIGPA